MFPSLLTLSFIADSGHGRNSCAPLFKTLTISPGLLGDCMVKNGKELGEDSVYGSALVEFGESLHQMADVKYALEDNVKQNFLDPLYNLQNKDLREVANSMIHFLSF